jgi:hypothetical protein
MNSLDTQSRKLYSQEGNVYIFKTVFVGLLCHSYAISIEIKCKIDLTNTFTI